MRLLLDTHALLWWVAGDEALPELARKEIENPANQVLVSAVSAMEIATKFRIGKLPGAARLVQDFDSIIASQAMVELPLSIRHARVAGSLKGAHKDPFDRMLIAQSIVEDVPLVSNESVFDGFGVTRVW